MADKTSISWTDKTWNPWTGCDRVSPGCAHCYMFDAQRRYGRDPQTVVRTSASKWREPLAWNRKAALMQKRSMVFTCSWSDFFHPAADAWRDEAWGVIHATPHLTYQMLTKRIRGAASRLPPDWRDGYSNVWLGVSIESSDFAWRADRLRQIPASVRFISYEPALGPLAGSIDLTGIDWLIYGGESGPGHRADEDDWARQMRDRCAEAGVAFFYKQKSGFLQGTRPTLDGETIQEYPTVRHPVGVRATQLGLFA